MEDIEYLDEYKDLVLPVAGMKIGDVRASSAAAPASSSGAPRRRRISSDSSNSSSIDADIFQKLFHGKIIDDELFNESEVKPKGRHPLTSSSSDDSNDALDALFNTRRGVKAKPHKRRERYESFDSGDDLGETLMRNSHRPTVLSKPSTSQAGAGFGSHQLSKATGAASTSKSHSGGASSSKSAAGTSKFGAKGSSSVGKQSDPVNGNGSGQHKSVTIIKATKTDLRPPKHEPKTDPLNLREFYEESDSDSSYEYESDFYGDGDSEDEDAEPVIDISTDTSRTTSVADTVTPVVSDDEGLEQLSGPSELNKLKEREPMLSCANERLLSYLNNLSCAEAPPIYKKQNSARKPRSNEKKPSSSTEQVKHAIEQPAASGKEEKEPEPSTSAPNSSSANRKLYDIDESLTLETLERMSLDLAEQIMEIDVERSYEFEKRSGSKPRSSSKSKQSADPSSNLSQSHVRKLTYSSEQLDNCESERQQLRRAKSESTFSKQKRGKGQKRSKNRAATTEEKVGTPQTGETTVVKRKRGRPRKHFPKEPEISVSASENKKELEEVEEPSTIIDTKETEGPKDTAEESKEEVEPKPEKVEEELDNAKELTEFTTSSQKDINMTDEQLADLKSALDEDVVEPDIKSAESTENGPHPARNTPTESLDEVNSNDSELNQTVTDAPEIEDKEILSKNDEPAVEMEGQEDTPKEDDVGEPPSIEDSSKNCNDVEISVVLGDAMDVSVNIEVAEATQNMQEVSDSQLAEDIKLAEEILAAEVGKGVEVTEATGASVQGQEDPVTEIVKELELETISEVVEKSEEQTALAEQTPLNEESPYEVNPPVSEEKPLTEESPLVGEAPLAPGELIPKLDTTPLSPAVTPKKSEDTASGESSVARRTLRSDRPRSSPLQDSTPVKEHESRSKRPIRSDISSILEESSRRNSPRLGRSPAESQDRSPAERKATPSKMAGEKSAKKTKGGVDSTPASKNKTDQINAKEDENTLEDEKPNPSETETEKPEKGKSLKPRKSRSAQRPLSSKSPKPDGENVPSSGAEKVMDGEEDSKAEETQSKVEDTQSSESEKPEKGKALKSRKSDSSQGPLLSRTPKPDGENVPSDTEKVMDGEEVSKAEDALENDTQSSESEKPEKSKPIKSRKSRSSQKPQASKSPNPEGENIPSGTEKVKDVKEVTKGEESIDKDIQSSNKTVEETPESLDEKPVKRSKSRKGRKKETKVLSDQQTVGDSCENPEGKEATRLTPSIPDDNTPKENNVETKNIEETPETKMEAPAKKPGRKTPSSKLTSERSKNLSRSSNRDSDVPSDKEEKVTGRLSRRDKALLENSETPKPSPSSRKKKKPKEEESKERQKGNHKEKPDSDKKTKVSLDKTEPQTEKLMSNETKMDEIQDCKIKSEDEVPSSAKESIEGEASDVQPENTLHDKVNLATDATEVSTSNEEPESAKSALDSKETSSQKVSNKPKKTASRVFGKIRKRRQAVTASPKDRDNNDPVPISTPIESDIPPTEPEPKSLFSDRKIPTKTYLKQDRIKPHSPSSTPSPRKPAKDGDPKDTDSTQVQQTPAEVSEMSPKTGQTTPQKSEKPRTSSKTKPASIAKSIQDTPSCRKLRILIKRTPTTKYQKARKSPIIRKTPTKSKRFKKVLQKIEEVPVPIPEEQTEPPVPVPKPEEQTEAPVPVPQPEEQTENSPESGPEGTDTPPKASENEEPLLIQPPENTESETNSSESQSGTNDEIQEEPKTTLATEEETIPKSEQEPTDASSPPTVSDVVEEKPSSADPGPELKETQDEESEPVKPEEALTEASENSAPEEISPLESDAPTSPLNQSITETETLTEEALEDAPITSTSDSTEITHAAADLPNESAVVTPDPESMETSDDTLDQDSMEGTEETPIPESAETTGVTVESESEASTSSTVKRSLRKREADPSLPDEAAKRKQQQLREKSFGHRKEAIKTDRRRNQVDTEDRPAVKRNRVDAEEKEKFISYIGQDTILSSVKKTKSEPVKTPLSARKTPGAAGKKSLDKPHVSANPAGKKPLVQTLLSSSLNLRKPSQADTPPSGRKSLGKVESPASESEEMTNLGSSVVVTKKSLPSSKKYETSKDDVASPGVRKVNISVSVVKSKETPTESPSPSLVVTQTSPVVEAPKTTRKSEVKTKDTLISAPGKSKASQIDPLKAKPSRKGDQELSKKTDPLALTTPKVPHQAGVSKKVEARKTFGGAEALARKSLSAGEISRKSEVRKSEGGTLTSRKALSQSELSKKAEARKSGGATPKELLETPQNVEAKKAEELPTEASTETLINMEPEEVVKTATKATKKTLAERKSELLGSKLGPDTIAASTSRDSSREDSVRATRSEKNATSARPRALPAIRQPGHVTRATSSNRSLAATPSSEIEGPMIRGRRRGRGGRGRRMPAQKRKADEPEEASEAKRSKEMLPQEVQPEALKDVAFPVKITAANLSKSTERPIETQPAKPKKAKKLCVKINRRAVNKWLEQHEKPLQQSLKKGATSQVVQPPKDAAVTSEVNPKAKSIVVQPKDASNADSKSQPSNSTISSDPLQNEKAKEQLPAATVPPVPFHVAKEPDSQLTTPSAPVLAPVPAPQPTASAPKAATQPVPEKSIPKDTAQRKAPVPTKTMPLPVPIMEVKDEPEDIPAEPIDQDVAPMPEPVAAPPAIPTVPVPPTINGRPVISMGYPSAAPRAPSSIPSASAASSANPNAIGQTKMFSFLYPNRYQPSYGKVGLDFCCPNLDGPMRAIDPTRLHAKAEVPVLEVPQFLVITTKFISKADKNIPHKVRAKLEMLGKDKELDTSVGMDSSILTDTDTMQPVISPPEATPVTVAPPPIPPHGLQINPPMPVGSIASIHHPPSEPAPYLASAQDTALPDSLDLLTKQLPKGTTLVKKIVPPGTTIPSASTSLAAALSATSTPAPSAQSPPALIQLPPIFPTDKHRVELQTRVQMFDMVLQTLSRRVANLTLAERQRTIEEIVKTSTLMPIDVDVGTKLLENYVHYLNIATNTQTKLPTVRTSEVVPMPIAPDVVEPVPVPPLLRIAGKTSSAPAPTPSPSKRKPSQKEATTTNVPLYDSDKNIIGFRKVTNFDSASTSSPAGTSRKGAASSGSKATPKTVARKSSGGTISQASNAKTSTAATGSATRTTNPGTKKKSLTGGTIIAINHPEPPAKMAKTTPGRTVAQSKKPAGSPKPGAAGGRTSNPKPNVLIINQLAQPEECILPDSNNTAEPMETEIKGEVEDPAEVVL